MNRNLDLTHKSGPLYRVYFELHIHLNLLAYFTQLTPVHSKYSVFSETWKWAIYIYIYICLSTSVSSQRTCFNTYKSTYCCFFIDFWVSLHVCQLCTIFLGSHPAVIIVHQQIHADIVGSWSSGTIFTNKHLDLV